ncbi:hypothetical protein BDN67DRAFT_913383, partial [Paxillus ammoniavirescens]
MLDHVEEELRHAKGKGRSAAGRDERDDGEGPPTEEEDSRGEADGLGEAGNVDTGIDLDDSQPAPKRRRVELDLSNLSHPSNVDHIRQVSPELQRTTELLANWATDPKEVKRRFVNNPACPEFPDSEWNNIILGKLINLDTVFSGMFT